MPSNRPPGRQAPASVASMVALGAAAGVTSGLFGVGGGVVMVPALVALHGFSQHAAHATSLAAIMPVAAAGAAVFALSSEVDPWSAVLLSLGSILGAQLGARVMARTRDVLLRAVYGALLIATATALVIR